MGTVVNSNVAAIAAQHALAHSQRVLDKSMAQLSTGQRINSAADDAAGLAAGNKMQAQIRSLDVAMRNANDGISMLQTADSASAAMDSMLVRMRELAIQSANDTNSPSDRAALQIEFQGLQDQLGNTIGQTTWNGMKLLDGEPGSGGAVHFHVGAQGSDSITLPLSTFDSQHVQTVKDRAQTRIDSLAGAGSALDQVDKAIAQIDTERARWGATMNRLTHAADNAAQVALHTSASRSQILDTDYAQATADMARAMILDQAGAAMLSQANQQPMYVLALLR